MSLLDRVQQRKGLSTPPPKDTSPSPPTYLPAPPPAAKGLLSRTGAPPVVKSGLAKTTVVHRALIKTIKDRLIEELAGATAASSNEGIAERISELISDEARIRNLALTRQEKFDLLRNIRGDILGLGPLEDFLDDDEITEIMVNGHEQLFIEKKGSLIEFPAVFDSDAQLMQVISRIVDTIGRHVDESSPMVDARLRDGSRVNVIIPPIAINGPILTIRRFTKNPYQVSNLVEFGSITPDMVTYLDACVKAHLNIVVSGGTGSGKTTFLNVLSGFIPDTERIVTIEDAAELQLRQEHVIGLETRAANAEGRGRITIRDLVVTALRMRPDRIIVGECRGGEALDMLQAMTTGHDGSLTTIHANSPPEMLSRLETLVLMAGTELPAQAIKEQIGSGIQIVVQQARLQGGVRLVTSITEVHGYQGEHFALKEIFKFTQEGVTDEGVAFGKMSPTGTMPGYFQRIEAEGIHLDPHMFEVKG